VKRAEDWERERNVSGGETTGEYGHRLLLRSQTSSGEGRQDRLKDSRSYEESKLINSHRSRSSDSFGAGVQTGKTTKRGMGKAGDGGKNGKLTLREHGLLGCPAAGVQKKGCQASKKEGMR